MENLNEGKKGKSNYMTELAEIDKQSALVALEAKINKLAEMAEAKTNRLSMVHEDENLSELISKQAVKEMQRSIKEIERLKEKLLKEFTKKGGKMTEVIDEDEEMKEAQMIPDKNEDGTYDMSSVGMKEEELEEGYSSTAYEEDDIEEEIEKFDAEADFRDQLKKHKANYDKTKTKPAQVAKEKLPTLYKESTNEEFLRMQKLAGVISEEEYKNRLNEEYKGKDLLGALKEIQKKLTAEKINVAPLQTGRDFSDEIKNKVANNQNLAAILLNKSGTHALQASAKIIVNGMASSKLDQILKGMGFEKQRFEKGGKISKDLSEPGEIFIGNEQSYKLGKDGFLYDVLLGQIKD
tara:strand:- start:53 stop:1105 length:1053 start_codon:yes stop_codon:yes gene_type:complete